MSRSFARDYTTEVILGNIPGRVRVSIRGHDESVPNGGPFGLGPTFGVGSYQFDQSAIDRNATPAVVKVASTSTNDDGDPVGTGARTVRVVGLDANGDSQVETVTMNGQTEVTTANTYSAIFTLIVLTVGSTGSNVGTIWCGTGTFTSGVPAVRMISMEVNGNIALSAYYVVPLAKTFVLRQFIVTVGTSNKEVEVLIETSPDGAMWTVQGPFGLSSGNLDFNVIALPKFASGTHLRLRAAGNAASTAVTSIIAGELIDD